MAVAHTCALRIQTALVCRFSIIVHALLIMYLEPTIVPVCVSDINSYKCVNGLFFAFSHIVDAVGCVFVQFFQSIYLT